MKQQKLRSYLHKHRSEKKGFTRRTASLAAKTRMSAQETTPGHSSSSSDLIMSITSKPFRLSLGGESFSESIPSTASNKIEASHPCNFFLSHIGNQSGRTTKPQDKVGKIHVIGKKKIFYQKRKKRTKNSQNTNQSQK